MCAQQTIQIADLSGRKRVSLNKPIPSGLNSKPEGTKKHKVQNKFLAATTEIGAMLITLGSNSGKLCFAGGTVILLNEGRKAIVSIVVGDCV